MVCSVKLAKLCVSKAMPSYTDEMTPGEILENFAVRRGCLQAGGAPDLEKAAAILMNEYRSGRFGQISLEVPPAAEKTEESSRETAEDVQ